MAVKPTVLVVEDVVLVRLLVVDYLRACGFQVIEAGNTDEAIRVLRARRPIDVVFTDVNMPGVEDGFGLMRWTRRNAPEVKVILGSGVADTTERAAALGYRGPIIAKPYNHLELERRLRDTLRGTS
jgi:CheY-like chemotaxis protein